MGIFGLFKELKEIKEELKEAEEQADKYIAMTPEEIKSLPDEDLAIAVHVRLFERVDNEGIETLNKQERAYYIVSSYDFEHTGYAKNMLDVLDCEEFRYITELPDAFTEVGAEEYRKLLDNFVYNNELKFTELEEMSTRRLIKALKKCKVFTGNDYDKQYNELQENTPLEKITDAYILSNRDKFI